MFSQAKDQQNSARNFHFFKYFLNNLLLTVFMQNTLSKLVELMQQKMNESLLEKTRARFCVVVFGKVCAKFKFDSLNRFCARARQLFTIQKPFPSEIPLTIKTATSNSLETFSDQITICQISFKIFGVKQICA